MTIRTRQREEGLQLERGMGDNHKVLNMYALLWVLLVCILGNPLNQKIITTLIKFNTLAMILQLKQYSCWALFSFQLMDALMHLLPK